MYIIFVNVINQGRREGLIGCLSSLMNGLSKSVKNHVSGQLWCNIDVHVSVQSLEALAINVIR